MNSLDKEILLKEAGIMDSEKKKQKDMFNEMKVQETDKNVKKIRKNKIKKDVAEKVLREGHVTSTDDLRAVLRTLERS